MQLVVCILQSVLPLLRPHTTCHVPQVKSFYEGITSGALRMHDHLAYCLLSVTRDTVSTLAMRA